MASRSRSCRSGCRRWIHRRVHGCCCCSFWLIFNFFQQQNAESVQLYKPTILANCFFFFFHSLLHMYTRTTLTLWHNWTGKIKLMRFLYSHNFLFLRFWLLLKDEKESSYHRHGHSCGAGASIRLTLLALISFQLIKEIHTKIKSTSFNWHSTSSRHWIVSQKADNDDQNSPFPFCTANKKNTICGATRAKWRLRNRFCAASFHQRKMEIK